MLHILLVIIYISFISLGLPDALLGSAWPRMYSQLNVPVSFAGIISMIISGCTIISSLQSGRLIKRFGTAAVTVVSVGMTAAALLGFSLSGHFYLLCIAAVPYGLGAGSVDAALNNFVALRFRARHMNWLHCFWGIGATAGPYIMGLCLTKNLGWHSGYRYIAILQVALTVILVFSLPLWKNNEAVQREGVKQEEEKSNFDRSARIKAALPVLCAFFCYSSLESVTGLWGSSYMVFKKGLPTETAALFISLFYFGITGGRFLSGLVAVKFGNRTMIRIGQTLALLGVLLLLISFNISLMCAGFVCIGLGCAPIFPALLHQTPERFGTSSQGMMGFQMACAYTGSMLSPPISGFIMGKTGTVLFPVFLLCFTLVMIFMVECANRSTNKKTV